METIKFRVWDADWKKMVYPIGIDWQGQNSKDGMMVTRDTIWSLRGFQNGACSPHCISMSTTSLLSTGLMN